MVKKSVIEKLYLLISALTEKYGLWVFKTYTWIVAAGYFLFYPPGVANGLRFYGILFPRKGFVRRLWCVWRQYRGFTFVFLDRFILERSGEIAYACEGLEHIERALRRKTGGVIIMSHMGNWEMAAHILKKIIPDMPLLLYMGIKRKERMEKIQKERLAENGVKVIGVEQDDDSPFELIDAIRFVRGGGMVSMTGDRLRGRSEKAFSASFLGRRVEIPRTPYLFALLTGAPVFVFFSFRTGEGRYRFSISEPVFVRADSRGEREDALKRAASTYVSMLERAVREYPFQWYHFGPFFGEKV